MPDKLKPLYPKATDSLRVVEKMTMPGFPPEQTPDLHGVTDLRAFYGDRLLEEFVVHAGEVADRLAFINKLNPHGLCDMMILAADEVPKSSVCDLSSRTIETLQEIAEAFLEFVGDPTNIERYQLQDGCFHFCYNYDRDTLDRESGMAEKRFHLHLNYWSGEEQSKDLARELGSIQNTAWKQRLLDPIAYLGPQIVYDVTQGQVAGFELMKPDAQRDAERGLPAGVKIEFADWSILRSDCFAQLVQELHEVMFDTFDHLMRVFTGDSPVVSRWQRNTLLPTADILADVEEIPNLSTEGRRGLGVLATSLRDVSPRLMNYFQTHKSARVRHLAMGGLNYSLGLYSPQGNHSGKRLLDGGPVYLVAQPKLFADMGGAGITYMGDIPIVRILRGAGVFHQEQINRRDEFQAAFLAYVKPRLQARSEIRYVQEGVHA